MDRTVPYDGDVACDECGERGSFDFCGYHLCKDCLPQDVDVDKEDWPDAAEEYPI